MPKNEILDDGFANPTLEVYDKFHNPADAKPLISLLKSNGILHEVEVPKQLTDTLIVGEAIAFAPKVFVKLRPHDFQRVNKLVEEDMLRLIEEGKIDLKQHFLYEFTNAELWDVIGKPDEWNYDTMVIAKYLLESRGVEVSTAQLDFMKEDRLLKIRKPKKGNEIWMVVLLFLNLFGFAPNLASWLLMSIICFGMAYYYWKDVTIDPNGKKFYTFDSKTRNRGKAIFILAVAVRLVALVWYFVIKS
ncbi:MAG: hypothetical protein H7246_06455 [Phycisphaerae bacterium]|nr:hypothetical protein [Saprospiraceae bacterium]